MSDKTIFRIVLVISLIVLAAVIVLNRRIIPAPDVPPSFVRHLPVLIAIINATCSVLLVLSFYFIKKRNIPAHKKTNLITFFLSAVFLVCYVTYHYYMPETKFGGEGAVRYIYYFILITHIVLAAIVLPLILMSFYYGLKNNVQKHRRLTRWSFPIWLYVTVTGVVVYVMISPYYTF